MNEAFKNMAEEYAKLRITNILVENKKTKKTPQELLKLRNFGFG